MDATQLRKINLLEVLKEQAEEEGRVVPEPPEDVLKAWSEERIRAHYAAGGSEPQAGNHPQPAAAPAATASCVLTPASSAELDVWFPGRQRSGTLVPNPRFTLLCFHSAGNAEDMYTTEGTGARRAPSPLLAWARQHGAQVLAPQLPGRGLRLREPPVDTLQQLATRLLQVVGPELCAAPYVVVAHSMGAWAAYELLLAARGKGVPMPAALFVSAMPAPDIRPAERPWRQQRMLSEAEFKEECRAWDVSEAVFAPGMWEMYQPILRSDFRLFDEYQTSGRVGVAQQQQQQQQQQQEPFGFPVFGFWGTHDRRVTHAMVQAKQQWLQAIVRHLSSCEVFSAV